MKITKILCLGGFCMLVASLAIAEGEGELIYNKACKTCHAPAVAKPLRSPGWHDSKAWEERFSAAKEAAAKGVEYTSAMDYLIKQVRQGKGLMQPGGMCQNDSTPDKLCTDDEYRAAILYMCENVCQEKQQG